jgi:hypothetical protein
MAKKPKTPGTSGSPTRAVQKPGRQPGNKTTKPPAKAAAKKPGTPQRRSAKAPPRPAARRSADAGRVAVALKRLDAAHRATREQGEALLAVADEIRHAAETRVLDRLAADVLEQQLLRDLALLAQVLRVDAEGIAEPLKPLRLTAAAVLAWFREHLGLDADRSPGDVLELEASRLTAYEVAGPAPQDGLVRVRVKACGWKRHGRTVVPPLVEVIPA